MEKSESPWMQVAWKREREKEYISIWREAQEVMLGLGKRIEFDGGNVSSRGRKAARYLEGNLGQGEEYHQDGNRVQQERFLQEERTAKRIIQKAT